MGWLSYDPAPEEDRVQARIGRLGYHPWRQMVYVPRAAPIKDRSAGKVAGCCRCASRK